MMIRAILVVAAIAATTLALSKGDAHADSLNIHQATLAEANQKTQEVSTEQLRRILADGSAIVLDTRTRAEFDAGHIPGARNLDAPAGAQVTAVERMVNGDKSKALVLYCNGPYCQASRRLADQLVAAGHTNVRRYQLGIPIWRALGGPTEIELGGIARIFKADQTAVFIDARPSGDFASGSLRGRTQRSGPTTWQPAGSRNSRCRRTISTAVSCCSGATLHRRASLPRCSAKGPGTTSPTSRDRSRHWPPP